MHVLSVDTARVGCTQVFSIAPPPRTEDTSPLHNNAKEPQGKPGAKRGGAAAAAEAGVAEQGAFSPGKVIVEASLDREKMHVSKHTQGRCG